MRFIDTVKARAKQDKQTIVLPESLEIRNITAAHQILKEGIANVILIGNKEEIIKVDPTLDLSGAIFGPTKES